MRFRSAIAVASVVLALGGTCVAGLPPATVSGDALGALGLSPSLVVPQRRDLVEVEVPRELRGLWVATVANLDYPSRQGLPPAALAAELDALVDRSADLGLNALVFQVRPEGDALYRSELEPWSRFLTGTQGRDPGFDPLAYLVEKGHARGLQVHAWFNPYRASSSRRQPVAKNHVATWAKSHVRPWGSLLWLDPGVPEVRDHTLSVVGDVLKRYDVDGIHLDDYFYPYPEGSKPFPDEPSYAVYRQGGGALDRDAWRRSNVDTLVAGLARLVSDRKPDARFGISPFGIYRPGFPEGVRGLDQVATLHADPLAWYREGWVDYLAPQLYWPTTKKSQPYGRILEWWDQQVEPSRPLLVGLDVTRVGKESDWTTAEVRQQVALSRRAEHTDGQIWFRATPILEDHAHLASVMTELYAEPALPPPLARAVDGAFPPPRAVLRKGAVRVDHRDREEVRAFVLYREVDGRFEPRRILGPSTEELALEAGTWAISAVDRAGVESSGARVVVPGQPQGGAP